jgi:polysaccharide export outer membrane protein
MNFKVSVQGEVNAPGTYTVDSERITLIEALQGAKDLTIYGKRDNILIIREIDGLNRIAVWISPKRILSILLLLFGSK